MSKFKYKLLIMWSNFWIMILGAYQAIHMPNKIKGLYGWIISQCGYVYMPKYKDMPRCHDCKKHIALNDDAEICIDCGGLNRRI